LKILKNVLKNENVTEKFITFLCDNSLEFPKLFKYESGSRQQYNYMYDIDNYNRTYEDDGDSYYSHEDSDENFESKPIEKIWFYISKYKFLSDDFVLKHSKSIIWPVYTYYGKISHLKPSTIYEVFKTNNYILDDTFLCNYNFMNDSFLELFQQNLIIYFNNLNITPFSDFNGDVTIESNGQHDGQDSGNIESIISNIFENFRNDISNNIKNLIKNNKSYSELLYIFRENKHITGKEIISYENLTKFKPYFNDFFRNLYLLRKVQRIYREKFYSPGNIGALLAEKEYNNCSFEK